jgi:HK97 family phage major capsid protein
MDSKQLNARKNEILNAQEVLLNAAQESKTAVNEVAFTNLSNELVAVESNITRFEAIAKGRKEVSAPTTEVFVPKVSKSGKQILSAEYSEAFWNMFKSRNFSNTANLQEGSNAGGGYLVPVTVDGTIVPLAATEAAMRKLALVIPTTMDIKLPAQLAKTVAVAKSESTTIDQAFGGTAPTFTQVTLASHMAGAVVPVSFELAQDVPALQAFLNADILRGITNYEENKFVNGSGSGEPMGILNGCTAAFETVALSINAVLDLTGQLNSNYYDNASFLMNRKTGITLKKAQLASNQYQNFFSSVNGQDYLLGYPIVYSAAMPVYSASPSVTGAIAFGDFRTCATIGDRGGSAVSIKVLDQISALDGVIQVLGYRRTDQRVRVAEAVVQLAING